MVRIRFIFLGLFLSLIFINAYAYDDKDFQVWNTEVEEFKVSKNSKVALEQEFRYGNNASEFYYQHYDAQYLYDVNPSLSLGLGYRQVYEKKVAHGKFKEENRPHINAIIKWALFGLKFDDRNRLEYRHFDYQSDLWRYRNKITAKLPWKFTKFQIQPYLSDEIFLSFLGSALSRNRSYCGLLMSFTKNFKGELYYLLQSDKSRGKWKATNVLGAKLKLVF